MGEDKSSIIRLLEVWIVISDDQESKNLLQQALTSGDLSVIGRDGRQFR